MPSFLLGQALTDHSLPPPRCAEVFRFGSGQQGTHLARIIHACRREAFETEARRGFSHVRPTQAYWQSVEEAEREQPRRARGSDDGAGIHE